ncbi:MAG: bleomycin resistance protein [Chitinophagaceae bacterium]
MLTKIHPKLPMRAMASTRTYYQKQLGFNIQGDYGNYLIVEKDGLEIHFFEFKALDPHENYGQVYIRTDDIEGLYRSLLENKTPIHPNGSLQIKPWGQKEFSLLDPDHNLLTFGQDIQSL